MWPRRRWRVRYRRPAGARLQSSSGGETELGWLRRSPGNDPCSARSSQRAVAGEKLRDDPETLADYALAVCRGIAYVTGATLGGAFGVYVATGGAHASAFVAVIIAFALVGFHMRKGYRQVRGERGAT